VLRARNGGLSRECYGPRLIRLGLRGLAARYMLGTTSSALGKSVVVSAARSEEDMLKCSACGALSSDVHVLEAEGGPMPDRGVIAVRIRICNSCYSRPERSQLLTRLCAEILVPPAYWFGRTVAWSSAIRMVRSSHGQRAPRFWYEPETSPRSIEPGPAEWKIVDGRRSSLRPFGGH
jgi:hypothetical protein